MEYASIPRSMRQKNPAKFIGSKMYSFTIYIKEIINNVLMNDNKTGLKNSIKEQSTILLAFIHMSNDGNNALIKREETVPDTPHITDRG